MKLTGLIVLACLLAAACNNSGSGTKAADSNATKDNTSVYDTGVGSSMTDTNQRRDTSLIPHKMQDTGAKK